MPRAKKTAAVQAEPMQEQAVAVEAEIPCEEAKPSGFVVSIVFKNRENAENFKHKLKSFGYGDEISLNEV